MSSITGLVNKYAFSQAMWGGHLLMPASSSRLGVVSSGIWDGVLRITSELDVVPLESTEAQNPLDVKGGDRPMEFSILVEVSKLGTGSDPIVVQKAWQRDLGKSYLFFVGALPISTSQFILTNVDFFFGYLDTATDGSPLRCDIALTFSEDTVLTIASKLQQTSDGISKAAKKASPNAQSFDAEKLLRETRKSYGL